MCPYWNCGPGKDPLEVKGASEALGAAIVSYYFHVKKGVGFCEELLSRYRGEKNIRRKFSIILVVINVKL